VAAIDVDGPRYYDFSLRYSRGGSPVQSPPRQHASLMVSGSGVGPIGRAPFGRHRRSVPVRNSVAQVPAPVNVLGAWPCRPGTHEAPPSELGGAS